MRLGGWMGLALGLVGVLAAQRPAAAQVSVYGEISASKLSNASNTYVLVGPTVGLSVPLADFFRVHLAGDLRGSFLGGARRLDGVMFGPRLSGHVKGFDPYAEFLVGFARYNNGQGTPASATSDAEIGVVAGLDRKLTSHFDVRVFEFTYDQYYALGGTFNPKTFSSGVVYHLGKR